MALTKETVVDRIEVDEQGTISVRRATYVLEDGKRITDAQYHRRAYVPGDAAIVEEDTRVAVVAGAVWTPGVIKAHQDRTRAAVEAITSRNRDS